MSEDATPRPPEGPVAEQPSPEASAAQGISRGRKVRLLVLVCVLVVVAAATAVYRVKLKRDEQRHREAVAEAVQKLRQAVEGLTPGAPLERYADAFALYQALGDLDPGNADGDRLAVALCFAAFRFPQAAEVFNTLDAKQIANELDKTTYRRSVEALGPFPLLATDAAEPAIGTDGLLYLRRCRSLWSLGLTIARPEASDRDKALLLARWVALHLLPDKAGSPPADPALVVWRGYGSPVELAWTYAEVARQMGVCTQVLPGPSPFQGGETEWLVQVYPPEGKPFLVDPYQGVPVVDPATGGLVSYDATETAARIGAAGPPRAILPRAGRPAESTQPEPPGPMTAVDPRACFPRFMVLDHLLSVLPAHARLSLDCRNLPADLPVRLWQPPIDILSRMTTDQYASEASKAYAALTTVQEARNLHIHGANARAAAAYGAAIAVLRERLPQSEVKEAAQTFREGIELASFFKAANAYDAGDLPSAQGQLNDYLAQYPEGKWRPLATALLAEALNDAGDREAAETLWRELPGARSLYGTMRLNGLIPAASADARPAPTAAPPVEEGTPGMPGPSPGLPAAPSQGGQP